MKDKYKDLEEAKEFERYREQMHPDEHGGHEDGRRHTQPMRLIFGAFMVIIYIGMGVLCMTNWFGYPETNAWVIGRWVVGVVLVIYGLWRAYRQIAGIDSRF